MLDPSNVPEVTPKETLTRYVISKSHYRKDSQTVKPDAFIPHPHSELSVTRLIQLSDEDIWSIGNDVATARVPAKTLHGRSDVQALNFLEQELQVRASPLPNNCNHADVTNWPMNDKPAQKLLAQVIARAASFVPCSSEHES